MIDISGVEQARMQLAEISHTHQLHRRLEFVLEDWSGLVSKQRHFLDLGTFHHLLKIK